MTFFCCMVMIFSSLTAAPLRFFMIDYHSGLTADIKYTLEALGHQVEFKTLSSYAGVIFGRHLDDLGPINYTNAITVDQKICHDYYEKNKEYLNQFDAFVVTLPINWLYIYEKSDKPILFVAATRYEFPYSNDRIGWENLNQLMTRKVNEKKLFIISNNKADQKYLKYYTNLDSEFIPSLCLHTNAQYQGKDTQYSIFRSRFQSKYIPDACQKFLKSYHFFKMFAVPFTWDEVTNYRGIVHFPYQISTMSIYEQYRANIPLFLPSKKFIHQLKRSYPADILQEISWVRHDLRPTNTLDPNNLEDARVLKFWVDNADFYDSENMPYIQYFDSFQHLADLLKHTNVKKVSQNMKNHNEQLKDKILQKWQKVIDQLIKTTNP